MKNAAIVVLLAMLMWFGSAIIRLENARYATSLGMCDKFTGLTLPARSRCLEKTQTRTMWIYNLLYGLKII